MTLHWPNTSVNRSSTALSIIDPSIYLYTYNYRTVEAKGVLVTECISHDLSTKKFQDGCLLGFEPESDHHGAYHIMVLLTTTVHTKSWCI